MNDRRDLEGLSALVTGATLSIGKAEELGRHGASFVVPRRDVVRGSAVVDRITAAGGGPASWRPT